MVAILDQRKRSHLDKALAEVQSLLPILQEKSYLELESDWNKIRSIEFREAINARNKLLTAQNALALELDEEFWNVVCSALLPICQCLTFDLVSGGSRRRAITNKTFTVFDLFFPYKSLKLKAIAVCACHSLTKI